MGLASFDAASGMVENEIPLASVTRPIQERAPAACQRNEGARTSAGGAPDGRPMQPPDAACGIDIT
ncbi:hypothetical protein CJO75_24270 (plasmid) [Ralstonia solanacearum]|nr:hypothetical protein CJO75_24270 [Ralstonia solanacearum]